MEIAENKIRNFGLRQWIATILSVGNVIAIVISSILFLVGYLDWQAFSAQLTFSSVALLIALIIFKMPAGLPRYEPNRARRLTEFSFIIGGALFGSILIFFLSGAILMQILGGPIPSGNFGNAYLLFSFVIGPFIGGAIGYIVYRKSKYSKPAFYSPFY